MKNKKFIKDIVLFILILMYFASNIINREVSNLDELWNYNFARNIANGLVPYKDFNMVVTPLLSIFGGLFLKIFGEELIVIRVLNVILNTFAIFMMYKIMGVLNIKKYISLILLIIFTYVYRPYAMFDYNYAVALVSLIILYLEIKNYNNNTKRYQILIGSLAGLCITLKQTTGLIVTIALLGYKMLDIKNKIEFKQYLKTLLWKFIGVILPVFVMIIYLVINNAFFDFIDYCIMGVTTFSNSISYISRLIKNSDVLIQIFSIMPIFLLILLAIYIRKRDKNSLILFTFGIATFSVVYPISDETHLISGVFIIVIGLAYILNRFIKREIIVLQYFCEVFIILFVIYVSINGICLYEKSNKNTELLHFKGLIMAQDSINNNMKIGEFIKNSNKTVYILDASAAYYMIPINRYNKNYDMFCLGNFGSKGEEGQIENLEEEKGSIRLLIKNEKYSRNWQNPEKVRNWVLENMNKIGQIGTYDIYE